jgi:hypothetical protein
MNKDRTCDEGEDTYDRKLFLAYMEDMLRSIPTHTRGDCKC